MLLNELKRIFEVDRDALQGALSDLNIRTDIEGFGKTGKKAGDIHPSLKNVLQKSIIVAEYIAPTKDEIEALTSTVEIKNITLDSLSKLTGTLDALEVNFTKNLNSLAEVLVPVATPHDNIDAFIQKTLENLRSDSSPIRRDRLKETKDTFEARGDELTYALMKVSNAQSYGNNTIREIKSFLESSKWFEKDGTTVKMSGVTTLRNRILNFYTVTVTLQQNTIKLTQQITAVKV